MDAMSGPSDAATSPTIPVRAGRAPKTYRGLPHTQLEQQPDAQTRAQLGRRFGGFPDVEEQPSGISQPGSRALCLRQGVPTGPPEAFLIGREFAHLHPLPDSSLHMTLPEPLATQAVNAGWGEHHPLVASGAGPATTLMVYAPRNLDEIDVVLTLLRQSYEFARGAH